MNSKHLKKYRKHVSMIRWNGVFLIAIDNTKYVDKYIDLISHSKEFGYKHMFYAVINSNHTYTVLNRNKVKVSTHKLEKG